MLLSFRFLSRKMPHMTLPDNPLGSRSTSVFRNAGPILILALSLSSFHCQTVNTANVPASQAEETQSAKYGYQIQNILPHDPNAFTQGLEFHDGKLLESTGQEGRSSLRSVEPETGKVLKKADVPLPFFAEGLTLLNRKIYQLTWQHQVGFIYDYESFQKTGQFSYAGEGWGLTNNGHSLILSDGTNRIRFLDPDSFRVTKTIAVLDEGTPVNEINELEFVKGEIYANIWHNDRIAMINPETGRVTGWIDLTGLLPPNAVQSEEAVLNGIAYDVAGDRLFVTGKLWPNLFEIRLKRIN
jgi:glutamine cyclotransferase